ncbi:hypothetical protein [Ruminococcus sp.]|uniref:hypothetical protein n=1 Tax=Ruminococcus sp. TaxID=41978 RepID=UPI0025DDF80C|nr:hypothetical protein [Ruminococcus sp.]
MKAKTYYHGDGTNLWGIFNTIRKEFQFGIQEPSPYLAEKKLFKLIGNDARKWRFEARQIPKSAQRREQNHDITNRLPQST